MQIYLITNTVNGKRYVGKTVQGVSRRWTFHKQDAKRGRTVMALHQAIRKYGPAAFVVEEIASVQGDQAKDVLTALETFCIKFLKSHHSTGGYNLTYGGDGAGLGHVVSEETRKKLRQHKGALGAVRSDETRKKIGAATKARHANPEWKAQWLASQKGTQ